MNTGRSHSGARFTAALLLFLAILGGAGRAEVVPVAEAESLRARLGQRATVRGVIKRVETMPSLNRRLWFTQGEFILFIRRSDYQAHEPRWNLQEWVGREVFATGEVADYRGRLELIIRSPEQLASSAETLPAPATPPSPEPPATPAGGGSPAPAGQPEPRPSPAGAATVQLANAAISQLAAVTDVARPYLALERFEANFAPGSRSGAPPLVLESFSGRDRSSALAGLEAARARLGDWPRGQILRVRKSGGGTGPGLTEGLPLALLLLSLTEGFEIPERVVAVGRFAGAGALIGGHDEIALWPASPPPPNSWIIVPASARDSLMDHVLDGEWSVLLGPPLFGAADLAEAVEIVRGLQDGRWQQALDLHSQVRTLLEGRRDSPPAPLLRHPQVRQRLESVRTACPAHLTASVLLEAGSERLPPRYSTAGTGLRLRQFYLDLTGDIKLVRESSADGRRRLREHLQRFELLQQRADPSWQRFSTALARMVDALKDAPKADEKNPSSREKKAAEALKEASASAKLEYEEALKFAQ